MKRARVRDIRHRVLIIPPKHVSATHISSTPHFSDFSPVPHPVPHIGYGYGIRITGTPAPSRTGPF